MQRTPSRFCIENGRLLLSWRLLLSSYRPLSATWFEACVTPTSCFTRNALNSLGGLIFFFIPFVLKTVYENRNARGWVLCVCHTHATWLIVTSFTVVVRSKVRTMVRSAHYSWARARVPCCLTCIPITYWPFLYKFLRFPCSFAIKCLTAYFDACAELCCILSCYMLFCIFCLVSKEWNVAFIWNCGVHQLNRIAVLLFV